MKRSQKAHTSLRRKIAVAGSVLTHIVSMWFGQALLFGSLLNYTELGRYQLKILIGIFVVLIDYLISSHLFRKYGIEYNLQLLFEGIVIFFAVFGIGMFSLPSGREGEQIALHIWGILGEAVLVVERMLLFYKKM